MLKKMAKAVVGAVLACSVGGGFLFSGIFEPSAAFSREKTTKYAAEMPSGVVLYELCITFDGTAAIGDGSGLPISGVYEAIEDAPTIEIAGTIDNFGGSGTNRPSSAAAVVAGDYDRGARYPSTINFYTGTSDAIKTRLTETAPVAAGRDWIKGNKPALRVVISGQTKEKGA
jgi:hypothetical protein